MFMTINSESDSFSLELMHQFLAWFQACGRLFDFEYFAQGRLLGPVLVIFFL